MTVIAALIIGLIGSGLMSLFLRTLARIGGQDAWPVFGVGSSIPTPTGGSLIPGTIGHLGAGMIFAYIYLALARQMTGMEPVDLLMLGGGVGILRGFAVSIFVALLAFDQAPLGHMIQAGPGPGIFHLVGNVIYGLLVSLMFGFSALEMAVAY